MLKKSTYKWLDLDAMCSMLIPDYEVVQIRYFTATLKRIPHKPGQEQRQQTYLRALTANLKINVHLGKFRVDPMWLPIYPWEYEVDGSPRKTHIYKFEEKGSDVNLATHLIMDAMLDAADLYMVLTNDSDQYEPLRMLSHVHQKNVGLILPGDNHSSKFRSLNLSRTLVLREGVLASSQLPIEVRDKVGKITKPISW